MIGEAVVVKNAGGHYLLSKLPAWDPFPAVLKGKVRLSASNSTNPVAVGDIVGYDDGDSPAVITDIHPRKNHIIRRSANLSRLSHVIAANVDRAVIAVSLYFPEVKLPFLDRILVTCGVYGIQPVIAVTKTDLYGNEAADELRHFIDIYAGAGYTVLETSVKSGKGIDDLRDICSEGISIVTGESGVGKSSLIKAIDPSLDIKTGEISLAHLQGKHTTSLYEMYPLVSGGFVIDSPGMRGFGLVDIEKEEISKYFPEMLSASCNCRFTPCTHTHEPGCAVKSALEEGKITAERYVSYLGMLEDYKKFR